LPGQLYFLCHGRTRLSSLPRSLSPGIIVVKYIYDHGPPSLSVSLPDIARLPAPLPPAETALATKAQFHLSPDLHNLGQLRTGRRRTDRTPIRNATAVPTPTSATSALGPINRVSLNQIAVFCHGLYPPLDSPGTGASRSLFLVTAPSKWNVDEPDESDPSSIPVGHPSSTHPALNLFLLPNQEYVSCVLWGGFTTSPARISPEHSSSALRHLGAPSGTWGSSKRVFSVISETYRFISGISTSYNKFTPPCASVWRGRHRDGSRRPMGKKWKFYIISRPVADRARIAKDRVLRRGGTSARRSASPRGEMFRRVHMFVVYRFQGIMIANIKSARATSLGTNRSPETLNISALIPNQCMQRVWERGGFIIFPAHAPPRILKAPAKPWPGPVAVLHVRLRVSSTTTSLPSGKILIKTLVHTVHIHLTRREGGIFSQSAKHPAWAVQQGSVYSFCLRTHTHTR